MTYPLLATWHDHWSTTLADSYSSVSDSCIGEDWFIVGSLKKEVGDDSPTKWSPCCSWTGGSEGPSLIWRVDWMVVGWMAKMGELVLSEVQHTKCLIKFILIIQWMASN